MPTYRAPPSPHARMITTTPATPQTRPFAAARTTRAVRHQNFRWTSVEHRSVPTDQHRPTPRHHAIELHQGAQHHPLPSPTPIALCTVDHDELSLRSSVHSRHYKYRHPPLEFFTPFYSPLLTDRATPFPEQGEQHFVGISPEPAASGEEGSQRLEPPQEEPPVPGDSPSSISSFARLADPRLSPGEPPTTPT